VLCDSGDSRVIRFRVSKYGIDFYTGRLDFVGLVFFFFFCGFFFFFLAFFFFFWAFFFFFWCVAHFFFFFFVGRRENKRESTVSNKSRYEGVL